MSLGWILALTGGGLLSAAGLAAAIIFLPPTVWANILTTVRAALGALLDFLGWDFSGWPLRAYLTLLVLVAVIGAGSYWWAWHHAYDAGQATCEAAHRAAAAAEVKRQAAAGNAAVADSKARTDQSAQKDQRAQTIVRYVKEQAHALPDATRQCVGSALADRLRDIN